MKENVYKHLIITKTDVQDSVSVLRKTWKTIRCKVTRGKKRPWTHGIQIYRLRSRSHVRWRDFKPAVDAACVCSLCGRAVITKVLHQCMQKNKYILFVNTLNLSTVYICIISISYLSRIVQDGFLCHQLNFDIFSNPAESESHCINIFVDIKQGHLWKMLDALW